MKKILALTLALVMALALVACGGKTDVPADTGDEGATGSVYYLNFKPEADAAFQQIAADYTALTGVPVTIITAASGSYDTTLVAELAKTDAPSLFVMTNTYSLKDYGDYALDLTGTDVVGQMTNTDFSMSADGELKAIAYCTESYGIITNKALLAQAGYSVEDITDFASLKTVAEDIHARSAELGFDAFTSAGLDGSSSWRFSGHLSNMPLYYEFRDNGISTPPATIEGSYLDNYRAIWDLYIDNAATAKTSLSAATGDQAEAEFGEGKAVFFQNGTWEWSNLTGTFGMNPDDITMIPIYCGVEGEEQSGLCTGSENYWAVNKNVSAEDQKATLDFLYWLVTSEEGTAMMAEQFGSIPFQAAKVSDNGFVKAAEAYVADGCYPVTWAFSATPNVDSWRATVVTALTAYSADQSDEKWADVVSAFVDGWAFEYNVVMG